MMTDDHRRWRRLTPQKEKGESSDSFQDMVNWAETRWKTRTQALCIDGGREFGYKSLETWCTKRGTTVEVTAPYNPHQNGVSERSIGIVCQVARTMLIDSGLPLYLWPLATTMATEILNLVPSTQAKIPMPSSMGSNHR